MFDKFGDRLRRVRQECGLSQTEFGQRLGVSLPTVNRFENSDRLPNAELIIALMREFDADPVWLLTGEERSGGDCRKIPILKGLPEDYERIPKEFIEGWVSLPTLPEKCFGFRVRDEAMAPALKGSDLALFKPGPVEVGDVVIFSDDWNDIKIRRFRLNNNEVILVPENPEYPPLAFDTKYKIIGKVIRGIREIRM